MNTISHNQKGAVLIVAIIFLALTAIVSTSVLNTSVLEVKMVGNAQFKEEAFQVTEGVLDAISSNYQTTLPVRGAVGYTICAAGSSDQSCNEATMRIPSEVSNVATGVDLNYRAERQGPLFAPLPFRQNEQEASSAGAFNVAIFEVSSIYDGREERLGYHEVYQGVAIRVATSAQ